VSAVLEVQNLNVDITVGAGELHAVRSIDFSVDQGQTLCIVGESGCGKSITSLAIMDLLPARATRTADRLLFGGADLRAMSERQMANIRGDRMVMIFQEPMTSLNPAYTIGNQLMEPYLRHKKSGKKEAEERAVYLLEKVGITGARGRLGQYPHQLSGGLRQRVMIAMSLMCDPSLIIADEPTTALDVTIQAQILHLLADLQREFNAAMMLITHDLGVVARVADKVAVMYAGEIVEQGAVAEVFGSPMHPYTQGLLHCIPIPGKTRRGSRLGSIPGIVPTLIGDSRGCQFRNRCSYADARCNDDVAMTTPHDGHGYRCVLDVSTCRENAERIIAA
jgi:peptide/nickel transport system ATP-binding protein